MSKKPKKQMVGTRDSETGSIVGKYIEALERIADPRNTHFAGDAQVVARAALAAPEAPAPAVVQVPREALWGLFNEHNTPMKTRDAVLALLAAPLPAVVQVPQGWKLVPVEPTERMCKAAADAWLDCHSKMVLNKAGAASKAAIAAAPEAPATAVVQVPPLTEDQIKRHSMLAADCPGASAVILVSSLRRLLAAAPEAPAQAIPTKLPIPPAGADALDVVYAEGWNAACDAFFGGKPAPEPTVITVEAQAIPARWREALKRLRKNDAAGDTVFRCGFNAGIDAALAQLDALEGGE